MNRLDNNINALKLAPVLLIALLTQGCGSEPGCTEVNAYEDGISFRLKDKNTGENLIAKWGTKYDSDFVKLKKSDGSDATELSIGDDGQIYFVIPEWQEEITDTLRQRRFFLHLPYEDVPSRDIDTIKAKYALRNQECPNIWFREFNIYYNDSLYHSGDYIKYIDFFEPDK